MRRAAPPCWSIPVVFSSSSPPGRRYLVLTFGAAMFGMLLNLGTIGLLGTMINKTVGQDRDSEVLRIANIRRKRMTLAMLRGSCSIPMWSPITVTIALVTASIPGLYWADIALYSVPLGIVFLVFGWIMDRRAFPAAPNAGALQDAPSLKGLLPLLALALAVPSLAYLLARQLETSLIVALLIALPVISAGWLYLQERSAAGAMGRVLKEITTGIIPSRPNMRTEITLFSSSAFLGMLIADVIDADALGSAITEIGLSSGAALAISAWLIVGLSMLGFSPIILVTILAGTLPKLSALAIDPVAAGVMLVSVWTISVNVSPYSTAVRLSARTISLTPKEIGISWNMSYALIALCILSLALMAFA